ncbi:MAG: hypothetical protein IPM07_17430 [Anaerolineales bacterium]|nr:hypothetical protein [Anaerolineales bacterium]
MSLLSPIELKKQELEYHYVQLQQQYSLAAKQLRTTTNASEKPQLQAQMNDFNAEMTKLWDALQALEQPAGTRDIRRQQQVWEDQLPKIDFRDAWQDFQDIYERHVNRAEGGAALILAPDFRTMCADLFVQRMVDWLSTNVGYNKLRLEKAGIDDYTLLTPASFLRRLGSSFGHLPDDGIQDSLAYTSHVHKLTDKMCGALGPGHVLLIEVTVDADLYAHEHFLAWLLDEFWVTLVSSLQRAAARHAYVKCILFLAVGRKMPRALPLKTRYCPLRRYEPEQRQLAQLPLSRWSEDEIKDWLVNCSGLAESWDNPTLNEKAHAIFAASINGEPLRARRTQPTISPALPT